MSGFANNTVDWLKKHAMLAIVGGCATIWITPKLAEALYTVPFVNRLPPVVLSVGTAGLVTVGAAMTVEAINLQ